MGVVVRNFSRVIGTVGSAWLFSQAISLVVTLGNMPFDGAVLAALLLMTATVYGYGAFLNSLWKKEISCVREWLSDLD